jgi:hypothetical protein
MAKGFGLKCRTDLVQNLRRDSWVVSALVNGPEELQLGGTFRFRGGSATINRISSPELRAAILTYVEEKLAGLYGHNKSRLSPV